MDVVLHLLAAALRAASACAANDRAFPVSHRHHLHTAGYPARREAR